MLWESSFPLNGQDSGKTLIPYESYAVTQTNELNRGAQRNLHLLFTKSGMSASTASSE